MNSLILAMILTLLPISELRGGMPIAVDYAIKNNLSISAVFLLILSLNILSIFLLFLFLDLFHKRLLKIKLYKRAFEYYINKMLRKKIGKFESKYSSYGFLALALFVAVPFPATGAWTGTIISWFLGLERKRSIISISAGVLIAAVIMLLVSLGFINFFNLSS